MYDEMPYLLLLILPPTPFPSVIMAAMFSNSFNVADASPLEDADLRLVMAAFKVSVESSSIIEAEAGDMVFMDNAIATTKDFKVFVMTTFLPSSSLFMEDIADEYFRTILIFTSCLVLV